MDGPVSSGLALQNALLLALPATEKARIYPKLNHVRLSMRDVLHTSDRPIDAVYFIETGWISLVVALDEGVVAEVGLVGREGMLGLSIVLGAETPSTEAMVQAPGIALRMTAPAFRRAMEDNPAFRSALLRYSDTMTAQVSQTAACNVSHTLRQRLARWLLMAHDRTDGDLLSLTQEFLAMMLGAQRPSVTGAAGQLQAEGAISYANGAIAITDRARLEAASCGCYAAIKAHSRQLVCH